MTNVNYFKSWVKRVFIWNVTLKSLEQFSVAINANINIALLLNTINYDMQY